MSGNVKTCAGMYIKNGSNNLQKDFHLLYKITPEIRYLYDVCLSSGIPLKCIFISLFFDEGYFHCAHVFSRRMFLVQFRSILSFS